MKSEEIATLQRLFGDASNMKDDFDYCILESKRGNNDEEILYFLRKQINRCDNIAGEIERIFGSHAIIREPLGAAIDPSDDSILVLQKEEAPADSSEAEGASYSDDGLSAADLDSGPGRSGE